MSDKPQQITNASLYLLPIAIGNLVPLVTLPLFTRLLSEEDFGALALATAYAVVVGGIAAVGLPVAYDRNFFECRTKGQPARLFYSVVGFSCISFTIFGLLTWLFQAPISEHLLGTTAYRNIVIWSYCSTAIVGVKTYYLTYFRNSERAGVYSAHMIGERLLAAVFTIVLVAWMRVGVMGLVVGQLLASLVILAILAARLFRQFRPAFDMNLLRDALRIGYPLLPRIAVGVLGANVDKYLLGQMTSLGGVGIYSIGQRVANIAFTYITALQNVFGPRVYARMFSGDRDSGKAIGHYLTPFAYVSTVVAFLVAVFSEEIISVLAPVNFRGAIPIVTILALYYGILFFGKVPQIVYAKKMYLISILAVVTTALNLALGAAGIWLAGTTGAAWGALAAGIISTMLTFIVGQRCFRIEWEVKKMTAVFALLFAAGILTILLREFGVPYPIRIIAKLASAMAFVGLGVALRVITAENIALVRDIVLRRRDVGAVASNT